MANQARLRLIAPALFGLGALLFTACGGGDDDTADGGDPTANEQDATTTTGEPVELSEALEEVARKRADTNDFDLESTRCLAASLAEDLGEERAVALLDADNPDASPEELDALTRGGDDCFTGAQLADSIVTGLAEQTQMDDATADEVRECLAGRWDDRTGEILAMTAQSSENPFENEAFTSSLDDCLGSGIVAALIGSQAGADAEQISCLEREIEGKASFSQLLGGDQAANQAVTEAIDACNLNPAGAPG